MVNIYKIYLIILLLRLPKMEYVKTGVIEMEYVKTEVTEGVPDVDVHLARM